MCKTPFWLEVNRQKKREKKSTKKKKKTNLAVKRSKEKKRVLPSRLDCVRNDHIYVHTKAKYEPHSVQGTYTVTSRPTSVEFAAHEFENFGRLQFYPGESWSKAGRVPVVFKRRRGAGRKAQRELIVSDVSLRRRWRCTHGSHE